LCLHWSERRGDGSGDRLGAARGERFHAVRKQIATLKKTRARLSKTTPGVTSDVDDALLLETTFTSAMGVVTLTDALAVGRNERGHDLGADAVGAVLRRVVGISGELEMELTYAPRPDYGLVSPPLQAVHEGLHCQVGSSAWTLSSPVSLEVDRSTARTRFTVRPGDTFAFVMQHGTTSGARPPLWEQTEITERMEDTAEAWRTWSSLNCGVGSALPLRRRACGIPSAKGGTISLAVSRRSA
jgi:hypothetical protein